MAEAESVFIEIGSANGWINKHTQVALVDAVVGRLVPGDGEIEAFGIGPNGGGENAPAVEQFAGFGHGSAWRECLKSVVETLDFQGDVFCVVRLLHNLGCLSGSVYDS